MFNASLYGTTAFLAIFAVASLCWWAISLYRLKGDAREEYQNRQRTKPATIKTVGEAEFVALYVRSFQPRWALYASGGAAAVLVASPIALLGIASIYQFIWEAVDGPDWAGRGGYVFMFVVFFGIALSWALIAAGFARLQHARAPEPFNHALARARGEPLPEETSWRRRPKWARRVRPDPMPENEETPKT